MRSITRLTAMAFSAMLYSGTAVLAADPAGTINKVTGEGVGEAIGTVTVAMSPGGAVFHVTVKDLPPGSHGLHVHENGTCAPGIVNGNPVAAGAAGGHWDPAHAAKHEGPMGPGHLGDLPPLVVAADGSANVSVTAPHIKDLEALRGHAMVVHAGGDNFSDQPAPLGGGGARIACGVIK